MKKFPIILLVVLAVAVPADAARAQVIMALAANAAGNQVVFTFNAARPGTILDGPNPVTGLNAANESLVGFDQSPLSGRVVGVSASPFSAGNTYTISSSGRASVITTAIPSFGVGIAGWGIDFDPTPTTDDLRVIANAVPGGASQGNNYRIANGGSSAFPQGNLRYGAGVGATGNPSPAGLAYSNNVQGGGPGGARTAYVVDSAIQALLTLGDPNFTGASGQVDPASGTLLNRVNLSGVTITDTTGFDISPAGVAYLSTPAALYTLNLATGAATLVGNFPTGLTVIDITAIPEPSSLALCGLATAGLLGYARRKKQAWASRTSGRVTPSAA